MGIETSTFLISAAEYLINYFVLSSAVFLLLLLGLKLNVLKADKFSEKLIKLAIIMAIIVPLISSITVLDESFIATLESTFSSKHPETKIEQTNDSSHPTAAQITELVKPPASLSDANPQSEIKSNPILSNKNGPSDSAYGNTDFASESVMSVSLSDGLIKAVVLSWTIGLILMAGIRLYQYRKCQLLLSDRTPVKDVMLFAGLSELKQNARFDRGIKVSSSPLLTSPIVMSHSLFSKNHGEIVVPTTFVTRFNSAQQQAALAHEIAHLKRGDMIWQKLYILLDVVFFFQPLHRLLRKVLAQITEQQSDELAARWTQDPKALAQALAVTASQHITNKHTKWVLAMKTEKSDLLVRVERLMSEEKERTGNSIATLFLAALISIFVVIPGCSLSRSESLGPDDLQVQQIQPAQKTPPAPTNSIAEMTSNDNQQSTTGLFVYHSGPIPNTRPRSFQHIEDDDGSNQLEASAYSGDTFWSIDADLNGKITFNDAETAIIDFPANSSMEVKLDEGVTTRKLVIKRRSGDTQYTYHKNREEVPFGQDNQWFSAAIPELLRMTGWYAEQRVQKILENQGAEAVLAEVSLIVGDYAKSRYLKFLSQYADLSPVHIDKAISETATISSDYEQSEVLKMLMMKETLSEQNWLSLLNTLTKMESDFQLAETLSKAMDYIEISPTQSSDALSISYFNAMETIQSDFQLAQLLSRLMTDKKLSAAHMSRLLTTAQTIESDFELNGLLISAIAEDVIDSESWPTFFKTAQLIQSDFEMRRLFVSLGESKVSTDVLLEMLELAAKEIQSDNEMGQLLMSILSSQNVTSDIKSSIESAMDSIQSSSVRQRVENRLQ